jgi:hypothetical protein
MINSVRNTVLAVINKNNYGYISPSDFNLFAKQAQLDIFEKYFHKYNNQINKENGRLSLRSGPGGASGTGLANLTKQYEEVISTLSTSAVLTQVAGNKYELPEDYYLLDVIQYNQTGVEIEPIAESKLRYMSSTLMTPTAAFPLYVQRGNNIEIIPSTISGANDVSAYYIRTPKDPKWTYVSLSGGEPMFNQSAADYQDFELPLSDEPELVNLILQYAGISVRENDIYTFSDREEQKEDASEQ